MLVLASTLNSLGMSTGSVLSGLQLQMATADSTYGLSNLKVKLKNTSASVVSGTAMDTAGFTTVYAPVSNYLPVAGYNNFPFSTNFTWDGSSNLLIEINYSNNNSGATTPTNTAYFSTTTFVSTAFYRADNTLSADINSYAGAPSFTYSTRNNLKFDFSKSTPITWSPTTNLFTDANATNAYTGTVRNTVYAKPATSSVFTANASINGCSTSTNVSVNINSAPTAPIATNNSRCDSGSVSISATAGSGQTIDWYASTSGGSALLSGSTSFNTPVIGTTTIYYAEARDTTTGCKSLTRTPVNAIVNFETSSFDTISACGSYTWNSVEYTSSGTYSLNTINAVGCDSTAYLVLTITSATNDTTTISACGSYTWLVNSQNYTSSGTYSFVNGCNTSVLQLTISTEIKDTSVVTACNSYLWSKNGQTYISNGTYISVSGCDSSFLNLTITPTPTWYLDADNDGFIAEFDEFSVYVYNGVTQCESPGNGFRSNFTILGTDCNDNDNTLNSVKRYTRDFDGDGWINWEPDGDYSNDTLVCSNTAPIGYVLSSTSINGDCDDNNPNVNPGMAEIPCNGIDDNCDGNIDENSVTLKYFSDADGDGYGNLGFPPVFSCDGAPEGYVLDSTDCDDTNEFINPGMAEVPCNGLDDNCNGQTDENSPTPTQYFLDADNDGYGDPSYSNAVFSCSGAPSGYVLDNTDCNDADSLVYREAVLFVDVDGDNYFNATQPVVMLCIGATIPSGYVYFENENDIPDPIPLDCNDNNPLINPGATEINQRIVIITFRL
jgi:hypothetical protein